MFSSAQALSAEDHQLIIQNLRELYRERDLASFPKVALGILRRLVPCVFASYNELNLNTGGLVVVFDPQEQQERIMPYLPVIARYQDQHPLLSQYLTTGAGEAQTISDFVPWEEWQQRDIYRDSFAPLGLGDSLSFAVHSTTRTLVFFVLNRALPDFSERDRAICNLLRPHLMQALENAQTFTAARAVASLAAGAVASLRHGLVLSDPGGHVRHANDMALDLLDRYFPEPASHPRMLPAPVLGWLRESLRDELRPITPFRLVQPDRVLRIRLAERLPESVLLLEETGPEPDAERLTKLGLSPREAEVLYWVTQGKSNEQVGTILEISRRTVDKHLENIYTKLSVETRGQAMCLAAAQLERPAA